MIANHAKKDEADHEGSAVVNNATAPMRDDLEVILTYTERHDSRIRAFLQRPLDPEMIQPPGMILFPASVLALYTWHNGIRDERGDEQHPLFYHHHFLSLEAAATEYQALMEVNQDRGHIVYRPHLFPLFSFMGEWYMINCNPSDQAYGSIWFVFHGEIKAYDSLPTMLKAIRACYEAGAYHWSAGEIRADPILVAQIKAAWNPCRVLPDGSLMAAHP